MPSSFVGASRIRFEGLGIGSFPLSLLESNTPADVENSAPREQNCQGSITWRVAISSGTALDFSKHVR